MMNGTGTPLRVQVDLKRRMASEWDAIRASQGPAILGLALAAILAALHALGQ